jgi:hypothetical protein
VLLSLAHPANRCQPAGLREAGGSPLGEDQFVLPARGDLHRIAGLEVAGEQALGERVQELFADEYYELPGTYPIREAAGPRSVPGSERTNVTSRAPGSCGTKYSSCEAMNRCRGRGSGNATESRDARRYLLRRRACFGLSRGPDFRMLAATTG